MQLNLTTFNRELREASFNRDSNHLNIFYKDWAEDIHVNGLILPRDKLEYISIHGFINWYFKKFMGFEPEHATVFKDGPTDIERLDYYFFRMFGLLATKLNLDDYELTHLEKKMLITLADAKTKDYFILKVMPRTHREKLGKYLTFRYALGKVWLFIKENIIEGDMDGEKIARMNYIINIIKTNVIKSMSIINAPEYLLEKYPMILDWSVIYNRFKILLEHIYFIPELKSLSLKEIALIDRFTDVLQQNICSVIKFVTIIHFTEDFKKLDFSSSRIICFVTENSERLASKYFFDTETNKKISLDTIRLVIDFMVTL